MTTRTTTRTADHTRTNGRPGDAELEALRAMYPPKTEPMPDGAKQQPYYIPLMVMLLNHFEDLVENLVVSVFGDIFVYYRKDGRTFSIAPDILVAFGVDPRDVMEGDSYFVWHEGKPPEFVLEIGSPSTARRDLNEKRDIYASLGVLECWMFDPTGGDNYGFALRGETLVNGVYRPIAMVEGADGAIRGRSAALGLDLCWEGRDLRLYDPAAGEYLLTPSETEAARREAERRAEAAEAENARLMDMLRRLEQG